jgi:hypothetical protein
MLIHKEIKRLCEDGRLFLVDPLDHRASIKRPIYVSRALHEFLSTQSVSSETNEDRRSLLALFRRFISGDSMTVAFKPAIKGSDLKRLQPRGAEVWEFKERRRQFRVFGRFADVDTMIVLTGPVDRVGLDYEKEKPLCQQAWQKIFGDIPPVFGRKLSDYFSGTNVVPLGNP